MPMESPSPATSQVAAERLRDLKSVTDAALSYLPLDELLTELLGRVVGILGVDTSALLLLEDDDRTLVARAAKGLEEEVRRRVRIPVGRGFAGRIAASGQPMRIDDIEHADILNPLLRERGLKSLLGVPLIVEGRVIGVLHVGSLREKIFSDDDVSLLQRAGDRAALAIQGRLTERERGLAQTFQESLIPRLPEVPGVELAGRYLPAASAKLGGDWYDAFLLPGGQLAVAIGDVVGRGFHAAALMAQLRSGLRAYALDGVRPSRVLKRLSQLLRHIESQRTATILFMVVDPYRGNVLLSTAGHPPPLIVDDRGARFAEVPGSVPLGAVRDPHYQDTQLPLPVGAALVLYTDGLIEQPPHDPELGPLRLRDVAANADRDLHRLCGEIVAALLPDGPAHDDVALLAVRATGLPDPLILSLPAEVDSVPLMRRVLSVWLEKGGASRPEIDEITLACSEAYANACEHAYAPVRGEVEVTAARANGSVVVTVHDSGTWRAPRGANRGRGLMLMEALMETVDVQSGDDGTTVRMARPLTTEGP